MTMQSLKYRGTQDCPIAIYEIDCGADGFTQKEHWHNDTEFLAVTRGHLTCKVNGHSFDLNTGDILLLEPRVFHQFRSTDAAAWIELIFSAEAVTLPEQHILQSSMTKPLYRGQLQFPRVLHPDHPAYPEFYNTFSQIHRCRMGYPNYKLLRFAATINLCAAIAPYCILNTEASLPTDLPDHPTVKKAMIYIHNRYTQELTLEQIAQQVHLHPNYLCALFKKCTGESIFQHIARKRVEYAATLLRNEHMSISQVSEISGFRSESLFFKKFRQIMGCTPLQYAKLTNDRG